MHTHGRVHTHAHTHLLQSTLVSMLLAKSSDVGRAGTLKLFTRYGLLVSRRSLERGREGRGGKGTDGRGGEWEGKGGGKRGRRGRR